MVQRLMAIQFTAHHGQRSGEWMDGARHAPVTSPTQQPAPGEAVRAA